MTKEFVTERLKLKDLYPERAEALAKESGIDIEDLELVRKGITGEKIETVENERAVISFINMETVDRDNEIIDPDGAILKYYNKVVPYGHDYRGLPMGKSMWIKPATKKGKRGLLAKTIFLKRPPINEELYHMFTDDIAGTGPVLNSWSIGFIPLKWEELPRKGESKEGETDTRPRRKYTKWELLEYSGVMIPSNREALTEMVAKGLIKSDKLKKDIGEFVEIEEEVCPECGSSSLEVIEEGKHVHCTKCDWGEDNRDVVELKESEEILEKEVVTKIEETDKYIRIPSKGEEGKHKGHKIRWITVSAKEGIRGIYCIDCKKIITYVFMKDKGWTLAKAKKWMKDHGKDIKVEVVKAYGKELTFVTEGGKTLDFIPPEGTDNEGVIELVDDKDIKIGKPEYKERWNKSLPKIFDVSEIESPKPKPFSYELYGKFLDCKIKEIFKNTYSIPSPLIGTYLAGLKEILSRFDLKDTRNFSWDGTELPPEYEVIQLNSTQSDDFLISGIRFYDADSIPLIVKYTPDWGGFNTSFITSSQHKKWNKELLTEIHKWVEENNFLKREKFSLSGEFLDKSEDDWDNLILKPETKDILRKSVSYLMKKKDNLASRGLLFVGLPGTGKTKTGRVLMNKADATFIWVSSRDFRRVGPLNALTLSFSLARQLAPTILFIEDIDTWLKEWGNQDSVVVDLLKTELDGIKQNKGIINILTSNYPEKLPDTLLDRPGRFHHIVNFELPQAEQRKEMLILWAGEIDSELLEKIVKEIEGFSGAHIRELVDYAYIIAEEDDTDIGEAIVKSLEKLREQRDLIAEIRENKKSLREIKESKVFSSEIEETEEEDSQKEGRVLSAKNRKLIQDCLARMEAAIPPLRTLLTATEPPKREEIEIEIEKDDGKGKDVKDKLDIDTDKLMPIIQEVLENNINKISEIIEDRITKLKGKVE